MAWTADDDLDVLHKMKRTLCRTVFAADAADGDRLISMNIEQRPDLIEDNSRRCWSRSTNYRFVGTQGWPKKDGSQLRGVMLAAILRRPTTRLAIIPLQMPQPGGSDAIQHSSADSRRITVNSPRVHHNES